MCTSSLTPELLSLLVTRLPLSVERAVTKPCLLLVHRLLAWGCCPMQKEHSLICDI